MGITEVSESLEMMLEKPSGPTPETCTQPSMYLTCGISDTLKLGFQMPYSRVSSSDDASLSLTISKLPMPGSTSDISSTPSLYSSRSLSISGPVAKTESVRTCVSQFAVIIHPVAGASGMMGTFPPVE
ncbi:hypothetical protein BaOVIS_031680 [Babesia ovis]|uniref:Uncharacterized protein n=1 Tax=Babesia ovis TaxID=5869 RepID=A0A9W5TF78_BABOV|nr:hypothetical protein BaOVIS_031680 [Babesia ovis]